MDDAEDLAGALLSRFAGVLEDLSTTAALASTACDPVVIVAMREQLADASALLEAAAILVLREALD
ncbi:hypothetical protein [Croceicoccus bisphenolivorans]|uniref:hypothetical protein n=1 Tax=Croceicoccus bisphenolivorans TaxID=1783232 RepID=UPI0008346191|nr:hypothetical protein [Croceicoccus bisphenolivorans]